MAITLIYNHERYEIMQEKGAFENSSLTLAQAIFWSDPIPARPLCAGIASCGRCKVKFISKAPELTATEKKLLTQKEIENNIRLSCRHKAQDNVIIELLTDNTHKKKKHIFETQKDSEYKYRLFVDIGTTSIAWQCEPIQNLRFPKGVTSFGGEFERQSLSNHNDIIQDTATHTLSGGALNPQMIAGADIMARLHSAQNLLEHTNKTSLLQKLVQKYLQDIVEELTKLNYDIAEIFIAANSSIMALSLGTDISGLCTAPYVLNDFGNRYVHLEKLPPIWIAPQMSAFIGADACSGLAYILSLLKQEANTIHYNQKPSQIANHTQVDKPKHFNNYQNTLFLLADMGTNGEFILYDGTISPATITAASVPLGPAIEGVGMRFGAPVHGDVQNIILSFKLGVLGLEYQCSGIPKYICGAAYLSLIHILLSLNILDRQGFFYIKNEQDSINKNIQITPLAKKIIKNIREENGEARLYITNTLYICSEDIENILKVKSAFATAIELLMQEALPKKVEKLAIGEPIQKTLTKLYLSGSLADYIPLTHLENLGFIPQGAAKYTEILGNSSLKGLIALSKSTSLKNELIQHIKTAQTLDLTSGSMFTDKFINNMHF